MIYRLFRHIKCLFACPAKNEDESSDDIANNTYQELFKTIHELKAMVDYTQLCYEREQEKTRLLQEVVDYHVYHYRSETKKTKKRGRPRKNHHTKTAETVNQQNLTKEDNARSDH